MHYINETGQVAYCLQTNYNSPNNSGYSSTSGWQYYDEVTIRGLQAILEHGYPNDTGGFPDDERGMPQPMPSVSGLPSAVLRVFRRG